MNLVVLALVINGALAGNIVEEIEKEPELSNFLEMVEKAGFLDVLNSEGPFSVIAPMNSGFRKLPPPVIASLASDATLYRTVLLGHIIPEVITFSNMTNDQLVETEAKVPVRTNVYETEGHTVHTFNGAWSVDERVADNGILHVVSDLVYPPVEYSIADNLKLDPRFSALKMAVEAAGLMETVETGGPFTLFAPVDAAFDKFAGKAIGKKEATQIVNKHLVEGTIYSLGLIGHTYDTLSGATINTSAMQNQKDIYVVKEGDHTANILELNQHATNGVIHAIDKIL